MDPNSVPARDGPNPAESPTRTPTGTEDLSDDAAEAEDQAFEDSLFDALLADEPAPRSWAGRSWSIALVPLGLAAAAYAVSRYLKNSAQAKKHDGSITWAWRRRKADARILRTKGFVS